MSRGDHREVAHAATGTEFIAVLTAAAAERFMGERRREEQDLAAFHARLDEGVAPVDAMA